MPRAARMHGPVPAATIPIGARHSATTVGGEGEGWEITAIFAPHPLKAAFGVTAPITPTQLY